MPFTLARFAEIRPFLYHVTDRANLPRLRRTGVIETAADLLRRADLNHWLRAVRSSALPVPVDGEVVVLKDQRTLTFANAQLEGCSETDFIEYLNHHVFLWPGTAQGPIGAGYRMAQHYQSQSPLVIRVPTLDLFAANPAPLFCPFNSGAPRQQQGRKVSRRLDMFVTCDRFRRPAGKVVEVVFDTSVSLPRTTQVSEAAEMWALVFVDS